MSHVDDELAKAVEESEAVARAEEPLPVTRAVPSSTTPTKRNVALLAALVAMGGGVLFLVMTTFNQNQMYTRTVAALMEDKAKLTGRNVRVQGTLVKGSLRKRDEPCEYRFDINSAGVTMPVRYAGCIVPDTFVDRPDMDVDAQVEGALTPAGHFEANNIISKCPSKYEMRDRATKGQVAPHVQTAPSVSLTR